MATKAKQRRVKLKAAPKRVLAGMPGEGPNSFARTHSRYDEKTIYVPANDSGFGAGYFRVTENLDVNLMDAWLMHDSSFDGLHVRVAHGCRSLWDRMPKPTQFITEVEGYSHAKAAKTLAELKRSVSRSDWTIFENAMRWNEPGGYPGSRYANPKQSNVTATKAIVRRVLEAIAK